MVIWVEQDAAFVTLQKIVEKYLNSEFKVEIYTFEKFFSLIDRIVAHKNVELKSIEEKQSKLAQTISSLISPFLVHSSFSTMYQRKVSNRHFLYQVLNKLAEKITPEGENFNRNYQKIMRFFSPRIEADILFVISRASMTHLLANASVEKKIHLIDSWDHAVKAPFFFDADISLTWNTIIASDVKRIQKAERVYKTHNYKFSYLNGGDCDGELEKFLSKESKADLEIFKTKKICLYPLSISKLNPKAFIEELSLVEELAKTAKAINKKAKAGKKPKKITKSSLRAMKKAELISTAKKEFNVDFDSSLTKTNLINKVYELYNKK